EAPLVELPSATPSDLSQMYDVTPGSSSHSARTLEQKKALLWGKKKVTTPTAAWSSESTGLASSSQSKFLKLMGVKGDDATAPAAPTPPVMVCCSSKIVFVAWHSNSLREVAARQCCRRWSNNMWSRL